ncbi:kinase/pyrophosphorylase [Collinsella sp. AGMB00827]|uniref:Kinase/pyrophosphorylase n=1 Tax=Collinsella ureilytica TaxID=2869515 RepID=A0ABS7ML01_9ACTN|nr:pyruvate, water dikinase regulatory protein [Collinsella urealyticum]MBY4798048.1 kinase/pyrophosphorylase [Collinsella urealyticum]
MREHAITVIAVSDALGRTAAEVAFAATGQFPQGIIAIERLAKVDSADIVERRLTPLLKAGERVAVLHTIADPTIRAQVEERLALLGVDAVDLLGPVVDTFAHLLNREPRGIAGTIHRTDEQYFQRIQAMEYFVEHDDGRGADDLSEADIVLLGISRTSKTPLSMYLAFQGYKVANIPLAPGLEPPASIFEIDPAKLFGLISTVEVITDIREQRLGDDFSRAVAASYSDPQSIRQEMEEARALMRRLGCFIVRTDQKAIEESAAEIIGRLEAIERARRLRGQGLTTT